jgi:cobalt-zinc-cadmium efflux system outer membrane protein
MTLHRPSRRRLLRPIRLTAFLALLALLAPTAATAEPATAADLPGGDLEELLRLADGANPEIAMSGQELRAAQARAEAADVLPDPVFGVEFRDNELDGGWWPKRSGDRLYTIRQMFPLGGRRALRREEADALARQSSARVNLARSDLRSRVKAAYAEHYQIAERARLNRELLAAMAALVNLMESRYAQGLASQQDLLKAQLERNMLETDRLRLQSERARARIRINMLLARPPDAGLAEAGRPRPVPPARGIDRDALARRAKERNPAGAVQSAEVERTEVGRKLSERSGYPDLELGFGVIERDGRATAYEAMVTVSLPLWFGARDAMRREAAAMASAAQSKAAMVSLQVQSELQETLAELTAAQDTLRLLRDSSGVQARLSFQSASRGFEQGRVEAAMVIDALRQLRAVQADILNMEMEEQSRLAAIERILGEDL